MKYLFTLGLTIAIFLNLSAQQRLKPGFDAGEYRNLLKIMERQIDSTKNPYTLPYPAGFDCRYKSDKTGLDNSWSLWTGKGIVVISLNGTTAKPESWLENFYSAMVPATGKIKIDSTGYLKYKMAEDSNAYIHAGWLIGVMSMAPDIVEKMREYYDKGYRNFIIAGHSQGGGMAFLLRSYLEYLDNPLPEDIIMKTYCSAAPKPGNLYYAYDFAYITFGGWGLRVVNTMDWVPEVPFGIQSLKDANDTNPFSSIKGSLKGVPVYEKIYIKSVYNKLDRSTAKAQKRYTKYLGKKSFTLVKKHLPDAVMPEFTGSYSYITAGTPVILRPGQAYINNYMAKQKKTIFLHHLYYPYFLASMETFPERD
jgi:hypothetical protein